MGKELGEKERAIRLQYRSEHKRRKEGGGKCEWKLLDYFDVLREI